MIFDLLNPNLKTKIIYRSQFLFGDFIKKLSFLSFFQDLCELLYQLLIELERSSKNQKNPHGLLIWGGDTFHTSSYHSFSLKPGRVKKYPLPHENSVAILFLYDFHKLGLPESRIIKPNKQFISFLYHYSHNSERHSTRHISSNNTRAELTPIQLYINLWPLCYASRPFFVHKFMVTSGHLLVTIKELEMLSPLEKLRILGIFLLWHCYW